MARNKGEFDRGGPAPDGLGESSRRAMQDAETGAQARARDAEDVDQAKRELMAVDGDGGGSVGAQWDNRSMRQEDADEDTSEDDAKQRREEAMRNERERLHRK